MSDGPSHASGFDDNDYARPNQPWQCGWAAEGHACPLGPTKWGLCRSAHECSPYRVRDTWVCARTKARGGKCDEGPLWDGTCCKQIQKCQPARSVLARRGVLSFTVFAAAIAIAFMILGSPNRQHLVSPGELSSQHSQVVDRCDACHSAAVGGASEWLRDSFDHAAAQQQSDQCLKCHRELGQHARQPHSQADVRIAELTSLREKHVADSPHRPYGKVIAAKAILSNSPESRAGLACATCHREHGGASADLTVLTNDQCQVCHVDAFHGFGDGHPEFIAYPYERRTRIYFDHLSHYGEHFASAEASRDRKCGDCHQPDSAGRYMLVKDFESTCAECHSQQIHDDTTLGIAAISLPALDVDALHKNGRQIGQWPRDYPLHVEAAGAISPLQRLLLQSYEGYAVAEATLSGIDLSDLRDADSDELQSVESLVWILKESLYDIVQEGHPEIQRRLTSVLDSHVSQQQITALANSYPLALAIEMQQAWLPSLLAEVEARRAGKEPPALNETSLADPATVLQSERRQTTMLSSGWSLHGSSLSLRYRPNGHADPLLKTWLDVSSRGLTDESESTTTQAALHDLFDQVSSPFAAGRCTKCHTVDREQGLAASVNWHPYQPPLDRHNFTEFSHAPHVTLLSDSACSKCHKLNETESPAISLLRSDFIDSRWRPATNSHSFESNFVPISSVGCAECHSHTSDRDRCLTCHNYHVH
ncbi:MAG: cytochrome c3 family protein [Planctomycetota bacterium]